MSLLTLTAAFALQYAIATNSERRLEGWPDDIKIVEQRVSQVEVIVQCTPNPLMALLATPVACAKPDIIRNTCQILYGPLVNDFVIAHEREHCKGHLHLISDYDAAQKRLDLHKIYRKAYLARLENTRDGNARVESPRNQ